MTDDLTRKIRAHIAELEALLRQLRAADADAATVMSIDRLEQTLALFRAMHDEAVGRSEGS